MNAKLAAFLILAFLVLAPQFSMDASQAQPRTAPGIATASSTSLLLSTVPIAMNWSSPPIVQPSSQMLFLPNGTVFDANGNQNLTFNMGSSAASNPTSFIYNSTYVEYSYVLSHSCDVNASYTKIGFNVKQSFSGNCAHTGTYPFAFFSKLGTQPTALNSTGGTTGTVCQIVFGSIYYTWCGDAMSGATIQYVLAGSSYTVEFVITSQFWTIDPTLVQSSGSSSTCNTATCSLTLGSAVTSGDLLLVAAGDYGCYALGSISDNLSDSYTLVVSLFCAYIWYTTLGASSGLTVTVQNPYSGSGSTVSMSIYEVSEISTSNLVTATGSWTSSQVTSESTSTVTPATGSFIINELAFSTQSGTTTYTAPTGMTCLVCSVGPAYSPSAYSTSWGGGSTNAQWSTSASVKYSEVLAAFPPVVTQPIDVPTPSGSSSFSYSVSGCNVSPASATSGTTTDFTASPSCSLTVSMPAGTSTSRNVFASSQTSTTVTTCANSPCTTFNPADYFQYNVTAWYTLSDSSSPVAPDLACMIAGSLTSTALSTSSQTIWCDYGHLAGWTNPLSGSTSGEQWVAANANISSLSSAETLNLTYYDQFLLNNANSLQVARYANGTLQSATNATTLWADAYTKMTSAGSATFSLAANYSGYLYQVSRFQIFSNVTIANGSFDPSVNNLTWAVGAEAKTQTGIVTGYSIADSSASYAFVDSVSTMLGSAGTMFYQFNTPPSGGGGGGSGGVQTLTTTQNSTTTVLSQINPNGQPIPGDFFNGALALLILIFVTVGALGYYSRRSGKKPSEPFRIDYRNLQTDLSLKKLKKKSRRLRL